MVDDVVRKLGYLTLGSRLKRIGDRLQADVQKLLAEQAIDAQTAQLPLLAALDLYGPLRVGQLVEALGITQPGVTKSIAQVSALGLVHVKQDAGDRRRRTITLTRKGKTLVARSRQALWPAIESGVAELCGPAARPLLDHLAEIEEALAQEPLDRRAGRHLDASEHGQ
jgi:DNA-binding MarR family transcriptional regulator